MSSIEDASFTGVGGVPIHAQRVAPDNGTPRGIILISHGYGEHQGRYQHVVRRFVDRGLAVVSLDHRGHGKSGGPRGHCLDFEEYVADIHTLAEQSTTWWPDRRRILFGHSLGGLIAFLYLLRHPDTVAAAALSAPAFRLPPAPPQTWMRRLVGLASRIAPRMSAKAKVDPSALARDITVASAYRNDPLVHGVATIAFFRAFTTAQRRAWADAPKVHVPVLILQGDADRIVDPVGATAIAARIGGPHELVRLPGYYHELVNEPEPDRSAVFSRLEAWFARWLA